MNIYDIKRRTAETSPFFFSRNNMKFAGQKMSDFSVKKGAGGKYIISAPLKYNGKIIGKTQRIFNPISNMLEIVKE